eukprot:12679358-Ditylum_brightwellii.AAC.1
MAVWGVEWDGVDEPMCLTLSGGLWELNICFTYAGKTHEACLANFVTGTISGELIFDASNICTISSPH